jgi:hypothetical protein
MTLVHRPCWICGNPADSREHKFKKSDVAQAGKTWAPSDRPHFVNASGRHRIRGPDSQLVKFEKVLCRKCNNTDTQPFDRAYERFAEWVNQKGLALITETHIDFAKIYGSAFQEGVSNLMKCFAKHLGCRIASENYTMPSNLASSLKTADLRPFEVSLTRNSQVVGYSMRGPGVLHNFPTLGRYSPSTGDVHAPYLSGMIVGYLDVIYRYEEALRYAWEGNPIEP